MKHINYHPLLGVHIDMACRRATALSRERNAIVHFSFNDMRLFAAPKKAAATLLWEWEMETDRQLHTLTAQRSRAKSQAWSEAQRAERQSKMNELEASLDGACLLGTKQVMLWMREFALVADWIGVIYDKDAIMLRLKGADYKQGAHVGRPPKDFSDRQLLAEWVIGQAMECLASGMPPHQITIKFVDQYFGI